jgi:signal transduction histidine kinase
VDLNRVVESALTISRNEWKYVAEAVTDLDPGLPPVTCLPGEMHQVLLNLIVNAAHAIAARLGAGPAGCGARSAAGTITVRTRQDGGHVQIEVQDTGSGIPEPIRHKVFDLFFTTKEMGRGTGQGLAIARDIVVDRHGGTISFDTEVGRGTVFKVRIPIRHELPFDKGDPR